MAALFLPRCIRIRPCGIETRLRKGTGDPSLTFVEIGKFIYKIGAILPLLREMGGPFL